MVLFFDSLNFYVFVNYFTYFLAIFVFEKSAFFNEDSAFFAKLGISSDIPKCSPTKLSSRSLGVKLDVLAKNLLWQIIDKIFQLVKDFIELVL